MIGSDMSAKLRIEPGDLASQDVQLMVTEHLTDMFATTPAGSVHALDSAGLCEAAVSFWTVRDDTELLGCGALKHLGPDEGEIKAMRTRSMARGRGIAAHMLTFLIDESRRRGYRAVFLETGAHDFFAPARRLYARFCFVPCPPFADYEPDPNSVFMTLGLGTGAPSGEGAANALS